MVESNLIVQIKALEVQLAMLKAQVKRLNSSTPAKPFTNLHGILAGKVNSSKEEIDAVKYGFEWEGIDEKCNIVKKFIFN
jgi:hypothetical protein